MALRWRPLWLLVLAAGATADYDDAADADMLQPLQLRRLHGLADADGDGRLSLVELLRFSAATRLGLARKDTVDALEEMDSNGDGFVTFDEIRLADGIEPLDDDDAREMELRLAEEKAKFQEADADQDGRLGHQELVSLLYPETHEALLRMTVASAFKSKDADGDGALSLQEFWEGDVVLKPDGQAHAEEETTFKRLDADGDGRLSIEELTAWESGSYHTEVAMQELLSMCDADSDGQLSAEELVVRQEKLAGTDAAYHFLEWAEHHEL